ncbi:helix-turn-helix domain-containing protein [Polaribacter sp. AHE13PA]|uniref:helix-turn-helix domain-containing protein n=1 Tax=Polaribacter sp. AHE13PA TaxID=2745562 RepID=UPI001C4F17CD|nr:helix-turn-helix transcriptional regulator [Polaribacter sp. AHE13PA]QXP66227.1 helix-turn-helix transcriptional regulator [Polaribacter sp. AHE13PA]
MRERERIKDTYKIILNNLEEKRKQVGVSLNEMALHLGLTENGYFKVIKGHTKLDVERLLLILNKLAISPKEFFKDYKD